MAGLQIKHGPLRTCNGPLVFESLYELASMTDLELYARMLVPAILFTFEVVVKKGFWGFTAIVRIKFGPVFNSVTFKPFGIGSSLCKCLKVSAWVKPVSSYHTT